MMSEMRAAQYDAYGPPEVLRVRTVPVPRLRPGHVLVRVAATSVNGADIAVRSGKLKLLAGRSFPRGTGFDFTGTVAEAAGDVTGIAVGDDVWGFLDGIRQGPSAAAAGFVLAPAARMSLRPPRSVPSRLRRCPAWVRPAIGVLRVAVGLRPGERVLVRGANGGVGTAAVQVARALAGRVTALASARHLDRLRDLGAAEAFDYHATDRPPTWASSMSCWTRLARTSGPTGGSWPRAAGWRPWPSARPPMLAYLLAARHPRRPPGPLRPEPANAATC